MSLAISGLLLAFEPIHWIFGHSSGMEHLSFAFKHSWANHWNRLGHLATMILVCKLIWCPGEVRLWRTRTRTSPCPSPKSCPGFELCTSDVIHFRVWIVYYASCPCPSPKYQKCPDRSEILQKSFPKNGPVDPLFKRPASLFVKRTQNQSVNSNLAPL